jgi:hypothetical protein
MEQFFDYLLSRYHKSYTIFSMHLMSNPKKISSYLFFLIFIAYVIVSLPFKIKHTLNLIKKELDLCLIEIEKENLNKSLNSHLIANENTNIKKIKTIKI